MAYSTDSINEPFLVGKGDNSAVVSFAAVGTDRLEADGNTMPNARGWVDWYRNSRNLEPDDIISLLVANNINPGILDTIRDFIIGSGVKLYQNMYTDGKLDRKLLDPQQYAAVSEWLEATGVDDVMSYLCKDILWFGNCFPSLIYTKDKKIYGVKHIDATTVRSGVMDDFQHVDAFFICDDWAKPTYDERNPKDGNVRLVKGYDRMAAEKGYPQAIWHLKDYMPGYPYYSLPSWHGAKNWIKLANEIPKWHLGGIQNGYNIKYHIQIPLSYFQQFPEEKRQAEKERLRASMDEWLSGAENANKSFVSFIAQNSVETDRWKIEPINVKLNDAAFTTLFEQSNMAMTSAHGIHPTLAAVETQGKLSSGSEMRNAALIYMTLKTPRIRRILLKWLYEVKRINGWAKEIEFGFENIEVTKLDVNPTATQSII